MSYFNIVCDSCGKGVQGITWMNGMKFCAKCYQETFGNKNTTENLNNMYEAYLKILNEKDRQIAELGEQLKKMTPKFKVGQKIYMADCNKMGVSSGTIFGNINTLHKKNEHFHMYEIIEDLEPNWICRISEEWLFATEEEAQAKLEELKGE